MIDIDNDCFYLVLNFLVYVYKPFCLTISIQISGRTEKNYGRRVLQLWLHHPCCRRQLEIRCLCLEQKNMPSLIRKLLAAMAADAIRRIETNATVGALCAIGDFLIFME